MQELQEKLISKGYNELEKIRYYARSSLLIIKEIENEPTEFEAHHLIPALEDIIEKSWIICESIELLGHHLKSKDK